MCRTLSNPYPSAYQMTQWCFDGHVSQENMSCWKVWKNCVWVGLGNKNRKQQKLDGVPLKEASLFKTCFVQEGQQNQQFYFPLFRCCWFYLQFRILSVLSLSVMINGIWCKNNNNQSGVTAGLIATHVASLDIVSWMTFQCTSVTKTTEKKTTK